MADAEREGNDTHVLRLAGLVLISSSRDKTIKIWDVIGGSCMQTLVSSGGLKNIFLEVQDLAVGLRLALQHCSRFRGSFAYSCLRLYGHC